MWIDFGFGFVLVALCCEFWLYQLFDSVAIDLVWSGYIGVLIG